MEFLANVNEDFDRILQETDPEAQFQFLSEEMKKRDMQMEGMTYTVVKCGDEDVAGMMAIPPEAQGTPPHWGTYVTVEDVDRTVKQAQDLGGKAIFPPKDIPEVGRFALIQDPQGAMIAVITYAMQD